MRRSLPLALALCLAGPSASPDLATAAAQDPGVLVEGIVAVVGDTAILWTDSSSTSSRLRSRACRSLRTPIRILGGRLSIERVLATPGAARVNFRRGVVPRMTSLRDAMAGREVEVDVRKLQPLSLVFRVAGTEDVAPIVVEALERMLEEQRELLETD
jgi:hypothetical protein